MFGPAWQRGQEGMASDLGLGHPSHVTYHEWASVPLSEMEIQLCIQ